MAHLSSGTALIQLFASRRPVVSSDAAVDNTTPILQQSSRQTLVETPHKPGIHKETSRTAKHIRTIGDKLNS
eukprot:4909050-Amphidinium_carterae.2